MLKNAKQTGFTLIEMLVALAILSLIVAIGMSAFDGSRSKAQALIGLSKQMADANVMAKEDVGCFATSPVALFDQTAANTQYPCKANLQLTRLYMPRQSVEGTAAVKFAKVGDDVSLGFRVLNAGLGKRYVVTASNVPVDIVKHALGECNGDTDAATIADAATGDAKLSQYRCVSTAHTGATATFTMQYAETR